ncbi:MAG: CvpA family protein [Clostridia bacterium]|nr:CvpA family protein [Clostridia bacterium]
MNWIDIAILIIMLIFITIGFWRGFMFSIISMFSAFINFTIALLLTRPVTNLINSWFRLEGALTNAFENKLSSLSNGFNTNLVGMSNSQIADHISSTLNESNFPFKKLFTNFLDIKASAIEGKTSLTLNDILSKSFGSFFSLIICFVIIFLLIYLILFLLSKLSTKAKEVEGIRITDRILGVFFGIIKGALVVIGLFAVLSFFKEDGVLEPVFKYISQSQMSNWIYSNVNLLVDKYITLEQLTSVIKK